MSLCNLRTIKKTILEILQDRDQPVHTINLIGRPYQRGEIEVHLGLEFDATQRDTAAVAVNKLRSNGYIQPTYNDLIDPENWLIITNSGRKYLEHNLRDNIDNCLAKIGEHLVELRWGMHDAVGRTSPDAARHAVTAAKELIDQVLKEGAPKHYKTRRERIRYFLSNQITGQSPSKNDIKIIESYCSFIEAEHNKANSQAHARVSVDAQEARRCVDAAERILGVLFRDGGQQA